MVKGLRIVWISCLEIVDAVIKRIETVIDFPSIGKAVAMSLLPSAGPGQRASYVNHSWTVYSNCRCRGSICPKRAVPFPVKTQHTRTLQRHRVPGFKVAVAH